MPSYEKKVQVPGKSAKELYDQVEAGIELFLQKSHVTSFELRRNPQARSIEVQSSMLTATLRCLDGELSLAGKLSLIAMPFKSKLDEGIEKWIKKTFG